MLTALYTGGVLAAQYITYTPVGMVRVLGVQTEISAARFPDALCAGLGAAQPGAGACPAGRTGGSGTLPVQLFGFALLSAVLLAQHYFIGPVCILPS